MTLWKVHCSEHVHPGIWRHWYRNQCVAVGWPPQDGFSFELEGTAMERGWRMAKRALQQIAIGDTILVSFNASRIGRIGTVSGLHLRDGDWNPLVPPRKGLANGELGRRIEVRWDLTCGPDDRDALVQLPPKLRFNGATLRLTIARIASPIEAAIRNAMRDPANWVRLDAGFAYERSLSEYIAAYPHHLEDGLMPHPDAKVREKVFPDRSRLDVLLMDRDGCPVVVECKQNAPAVADIRQLQRYMRHVAEQTGNQDVRGILVHGGSRRVRAEVALAANRSKRVTLAFYQVDVRFERSGGG